MSVKGTLQDLSDKESDGKWGKQWRIGLKVDGSWYSAFCKAPPSKLGLAVGKTVEFSTEVKGEYENWLPKTLIVSDGPAVVEEDASNDDAPAKPATGRKTPWAGEKGTKIGHAINNAVQIACSLGTAGDLAAIHKLTCDILALSVVLEGQYDRIIESAAERVKARQEGTTAATAPAPTPAAPAAEKPAKAAAAKPAAKPAPKAPVKAPDPEEESAANPAFSDDIPF
jgi:hypothetical protein